MNISRFARRVAFTLVEVLTVMVIIAILAGLVLGISGFASRKGADSRAKAEVQALSSGCVNYKADNGIYPRTTNTDTLDPRTATNPSAYQNASLDLYKALSGDYDGNGIRDSGSNSYMQFPPKMLGRTTTSTLVSAGNPVTFIADPYGNSYGYSTANAADIEANPAVAPTHGYNPDYDLWSTSGTTAQGAWVKNW